MTDVEQEWSRVVLIRHGESASNAGGWISGQESCGGLTDLGASQAAALRDRLASDPTMRPDRILVSTMRRAVETAEIIAGPTGLVPEQRAELMERTSGVAEGMTVDEFSQTYGRHPWGDWSIPISEGGESGDEFSERVTMAVGRVASESRGSTTWVVCHGGVIMVTALTRWPGAGGASIQIDSLPIISPLNTSISEWLVDPSDSWRMVRYNEHSHLAAVETMNGATPSRTSGV